MLHREKRRHPRVAVSLHAELKISAGFSDESTAPTLTISAPVTNLSPTGLFVRLAEPHKPGTRFRVRLELGDDTLFFFSAVQRVYPLEVGASTAVSSRVTMTYGHGLQIIAAPEEAIAKICSYIKSVKSQSRDVDAKQTMRLGSDYLIRFPGPSRSDQLSTLPAPSS